MRGHSVGFVMRSERERGIKEGGSDASWRGMGGGGRWCGCGCGGGGPADDTDPCAAAVAVCGWCGIGEAACQAVLCCQRRMEAMTRGPGF
jgi:hypothetical protein